MRWKAAPRVRIGQTDQVEGFLFWPRRLYTDARWKQREWRWLERARIEQVWTGAFWRETTWLPLEEDADDRVD